MLNSKKCFKCQIEKPISEFYRHRGMADGHLGKCKDCSKNDATNYRKNNLEKIRAHDRERGKLPSRLLAIAKNTKSLRKKISGYVAAHNAFSRALKKGTLKKMPCVMCQSIMSWAHHDDYLKPLDVMWLCPIHHKARHAFLKYLEDRI